MDFRAHTQTVEDVLLCIHFLCLAFLTSLKKQLSATIAEAHGLDRIWLSHCLVKRTGTTTCYLEKYLSRSFFVYVFVHLLERAVLSIDCELSFLVHK